MVDMQYVQSGTVECIGYDSEAMELHVRFLRSGPDYVYIGVPQEVFDAMLDAPSKGSFVHTRLKGTYSFERR